MSLYPSRPERLQASETALLAEFSGIVKQAQANAQRLDPSGGFPSDDVAHLRDAGLLRAVLPISFGGFGIGIEAAQAGATGEALHQLGRASIALGRIFEGHLNAIRIVMRVGDPSQRLTAAMGVRAGHLHALWVTDGEQPLCYSPVAGGIELSGGKMPCSAAEHATRAIVTAQGPDGGTRLLYLPLGRGETAKSLGCSLQGVRGAATGAVDFTGARHAPDVIIGEPGDYLREPDFSTGAWRALAVATGALSALVDAARAELVSRGRVAAPQQADRLGRMLIHAQTAKLWMRHVAGHAEDADADPAQAIALVQLARIAIEAAGLETIQLVQRSLGLSALLQSNPVERMCRDLATYLRQPAADEALVEAVAYFASHSCNPAA